MSRTTAHQACELCSSLRRMLMLREGKCCHIISTPKTGPYLLPSQPLWRVCLCVGKFPNKKKLQMTLKRQHVELTEEQRGDKISRLRRCVLERSQGEKKLTVPASVYLACLVLPRFGSSFNSILTPNLWISVANSCLLILPPKLMTQKITPCSHGVRLLFNSLPNDLAEEEKSYQGQRSETERHSRGAIEAYGTSLTCPLTVLLWETSFRQRSGLDLHDQENLMTVCVHHLPLSTLGTVLPWY